MSFNQLQVVMPPQQSGTQHALSRRQQNLELLQMAFPLLPPHAKQYLKLILASYGSAPSSHNAQNLNLALSTSPRSRGTVLISNLGSASGRSRSFEDVILEINPDSFQRIILGLFLLPKHQILDLSPQGVMSHLRQLESTRVLRTTRNSSAVLAIQHPARVFVHRLISSLREQERLASYERVSGGALWVNYHRVMCKISWYPYRTRATVPTVEEFSRFNIEILRVQLGQLSSQETTLIATIKKLRFNLIHNTRYIDKIEVNRTIYSKVSLERMGVISTKNVIDDDESNSSSVKHNSPLGNIIRLGNDDSVFFRFSTETGPTTSRFGETTLILDPEAYGLYECGWISLYDMLDPIQASIRKVRWSGGQFSSQAGTLHRLSADVQIAPEGKEDRFWSLEEITPELRDQVLHYYPQRKFWHVIPLAQLVFYGPDILEGIALSVLRELRLMGGPLQTYALQHATDAKFLSTLLIRLFRPEAKLPARVNYSERTLFTGSQSNNNNNNTVVVTSPSKSLWLKDSDDEDDDDIGGSGHSWLKKSDSDDEDDDDDDDDDDDVGGSGHSWFKKNDSDDEDSSSDDSSVKPMTINDWVKLFGSQL